MNAKAEVHLAKAEGYLAKGDAWYLKAANEIEAAMAADPTLGEEAVGKRLGKSRTWVRNIRNNLTAGGQVVWDRGSHATNAEIQAGVEKVLRTAPLETVEHIVESLPPKQVAKLAQAAMAKPGLSREMAKTPEASATVTRLSGQVREEVEYQERQKAKRRSPLGSDKLGGLVEILYPLRAAKRKIKDSYDAARDSKPEGDLLDLVQENLKEIEQIVDWYRSYLDSGDQSFEDELEQLLGN